MSGISLFANDANTFVGSGGVYPANEIRENQAVWSRGSSVPFHEYVRLEVARQVALAVELMGMDPQEKALLKALFEKPADADLRNVFADYLEDCGRADHAARIRRAGNQT